MLTETFVIRTSFNVLAVLRKSYGPITSAIYYAITNAVTKNRSQVLQLRL